MIIIHTPSMLTQVAEYIARHNLPKPWMIGNVINYAAWQRGLDETTKRKIRRLQTAMKNAALNMEGE